MHNTQSEDAPNESHYREMSPERRRFLEEAIKSLTIDVVENLTKAMNLLVTPGITKDEQVEALETVTDFVENIDTANDFYKIGGFCIIKTCLESPHAEVKEGTCELIAALAQNNPFCQKHLNDLNILPKLFELMTEPEPTVASAALHAVSSIVRGEVPCEDFYKLGGIECLLGALDSGNEKLTLKAAFLITSLCGLDEKVRGEFVELGAVEKLCNHLEPKEEYNALLESALSALFTLLQSKKAVDQCKATHLNLQSKLIAIKKASGDKDEFQEVIGYVDGIMEVCFKDSTSPVDR